jgi:hypothetical protein
MIYNERCTIVGNVDGSIKTAFVDLMGVDPEGRHYPAGQVTIGNDELTQFLGSAHNVALATIARLEAEAATKQSQIIEMEASLAAKQTELDEAKATIAERDASISSQNSAVSNQAGTIVELQASIAEKDAVLASKNNQLNESDAALAVANATFAELVAKIACLESIRQFNPRWTTPDFFLNRFTPKETKAFYSSNDPIILGGQQLFELYEKEGYYVDLDDPQVQGLTGYMVQLGMIESMERREVILRNATKEEAFYATV